MQQRDVRYKAKAAPPLTNVNEVSVIDLSIGWAILAERVSCRTKKSITGH